MRANKRLQGYLVLRRLFSVLSVQAKADAHRRVPMREFFSLLIPSQHSGAVEQGLNLTRVHRAPPATPTYYFVLCTPTDVR